MHDLDLHLKPSKQFILLSFLIIFEIFISILFSTLGIWVKAMLLLSCVAYGTKSCLYSQCLNNKKRIRHIRAIPGDRLQFTRGADIFQGEILGESIVTRWMCFLRLKVEEEEKVHSCLVWHDALNRDSYRRLCVYLRCL